MHYHCYQHTITVTVSITITAMIMATVTWHLSPVNPSFVTGHLSTVTNTIHVKIIVWMCILMCQYMYTYTVCVY